LNGPAKQLFGAFNQQPAPPSQTTGLITVTPTITAATAAAPIITHVRVEKPPPGFFHVGVGHRLVCAGLSISDGEGVFTHCADVTFQSGVVTQPDLDASILPSAHLLDFSPSILGQLSIFHRLSATPLYAD
jgi:hypothetical protein